MNLAKHSELPLGNTLRFMHRVKEMLGFIRKVKQCPDKRLKQQMQVTSPRQKEKEIAVLKRNIYPNKKCQELPHQPGKKERQAADKVNS